ncbi:MAG: hypothetical protein Q8Q20_02515 [bacterium]|nr:hypothetical protein [bacterium]
MRFFVGLLMLAVGFALALKPQWFIDFTGRIGVAERGILATLGGSRFTLQLLGVALIILAAIVWFADFDPISLTPPIGE